VVLIQIGISRGQIRVLWRAPQNPKSWISKALCAFEIQLLEKLGGLCDLLNLDARLASIVAALDK
jgi:hypothetical protein